ncbi:MAG: CBS domain-containing protein [Saccharolobus sp.]|jgi:predicted transcriptional regulator|uniref:CBS domain-containing protein n=1 Tax=Saccharolobus sp. TaxID=2100761 RepID=UPI0028CE5AA3|nr:CBS domain-containing protein [Saccharolobus sp.]MDT7862216.1 CBS domain-containing protein [Saccharolobus sp.]
MKLKDLLNNTKLVKINSKTRLSEVLELMSSQGINFTLVINDRGEIVGVVTKNAILRSLINGIKLDESVSKVMINSVRTISCDEDLLDVFIFMVKNNVNHLLVVDNNGKALGVVSLRDVLYAINKECELS